MAHIAVQKEIGSKLPSVTLRDWDPFRSMRDLLRWDPFAEIAPRLASEELGFNATFDVKETPTAFVFKADLPGIKREDLAVELTQNRLTVRGKREAEKTEKNDTYYTYERSSGSFTRTFTLPEGVDAEKADADLKDGVLTLTLPKKPEVLPKQINIKVK
jgi:HSP20 family protein